MFQNVEVIRKKMPEYGYKFLMPKAKVQVSEPAEGTASEGTHDEATSPTGSMATPLRTGG